MGWLNDGAGEPGGSAGTLAVLFQTAARTVKQPGAGRAGRSPEWALSVRRFRDSIATRC